MWHDTHVRTRRERGDTVGHAGRGQHEFVRISRAQDWPDLEGLCVHLRTAGNSPSDTFSSGMVQLGLPSFRQLIMRTDHNDNDDNNGNLQSAYPRCSRNSSSKKQQRKYQNKIKQTTASLQKTTHRLYSEPRLRKESIDSGYSSPSTPHWSHLAWDFARHWHQQEHLV